MKEIYELCKNIINTLACEKYSDLNIRGSLEEFIKRLNEYGQRITNFPEYCDLKQYIEIFTYTNKPGYGADIRLFIDNELSDLILLVDISTSDNNVLISTILDLVVQ